MTRNNIKKTFNDKNKKKTNRNDSLTDNKNKFNHTTHISKLDFPFTVINILKQIEVTLLFLENKIVFEVY